MLFSLGISHDVAGADVRDRVAFTPESAAAFRVKLAAAGIRQSFVLSTCNRCEIFFWGDEAVERTGQDLFLSEFPVAGLGDLIRLYRGDAALVHLFSIAAGLESMILGEYQILGQVKDAHAASLATGHAGKELDRILRDAVSCAKRVKTELDIGAVPPSVCRAGMELVEKRFGVAGKRVFVIGSGKTGKLAVCFAKERGAKSIAVCNRSPERAKKLEELYGAKVVDYAARYGTISESDLVVSATASPHMVVCAERLTLTHPVVFLDLASPRDVEPAVAANPLVSLVGIDTIGELAAGDRAERRRLTALGRSIVEKGVAELSVWLRRP